MSNLLGLDSFSDFESLCSHLFLLGYAGSGKDSLMNQSIQAGKFSRGRT